MLHACSADKTDAALRNARNFASCQRHPCAGTTHWAYSVKLGRAQGPDRGDAGRRRLAPSARGQGVARLSLAPRTPWARGARLGKHDSARTCEHRQDRPRVAARRAPSAPSHHRRQCINNIYAATRCRGGCKHYLAAW